MNKISEWYPLLGHMTFPTVFIGLSEEESQVISKGESNAALEERVTRAIASLPGSCVVGMDDCMATDSALFQKSKSLKSGKLALQHFAESAKVKESIDTGVRTLAVRPYRRMDKTREFRLFVFKGQLTAMSQRHLDRHYKRLEARRDLYWEKAKNFTEEVVSYMGEGNYVIDIYFTSVADILIVDFNDWGEPTLPLLFKKWDRDWSNEEGLKLMPEPIKLGGDIKVSF